MKIIFATGNEGKMREIRSILSEGGWEVASLRESGLKAEAEENGNTFAENAEIKAREIHEKLKQQENGAVSAVVLADDSGLCVDALGGAPGIYSARWMGHETPYSEKNRVLIEKLSGLEGEARAAQFVCNICAVLPDGRALHTEGVMRGEIAEKPAGCGGFGFDPILWLPEYSMTSAELSEEKKNEISHRGKALRAMKAELEKAWNSFS